MASTKRVTGDYNIYADNTVINGNLTVIGIQTSVESVDTVIKDRIVTLNSGETGAGVSLTYSGIEVDRGTLTKTSLRWNESSKQFDILNVTSGSYFHILTGDLLSSSVSLTSSSNVATSLAANTLNNSIISANNWLK